MKEKLSHSFSPDGSDVEQRERPKIVRIILLRHGETDYNAFERFQGNADIPLNVRGRGQARDARDALREKTYDALYSGPLQRQRGTAEIALGRPIEDEEVDGRLHEISGGFAEGKTRGELPPEAVQAIIDSDFFDYSSVGGERPEDVKRRVDALMKDLFARHAGETVLLVTSAGVSRWIAKHYGDDPNLVIPTGGIAELEFSQDDIERNEPPSS
jgi:probable phosphoglycerate mutase